MQKVFLPFSIISSIFFAQNFIKDFKKDSSVILIGVAEILIGDFIINLPNADTGGRPIFIGVFEEQEEEPNRQNRSAVCQAAGSEQVGVPELAHEFGLAGGEFD